MRDVTIHFDPATHEYRVDGKVKPSVSTIIRPLRSDYDAIDKEVLRKAALRGTAVHLACELYDIGRLHELPEKLDIEAPEIDVILPYLDAWIAFCKKGEWEWTHIEHIDYHRELEYCGTADRMGLWKGKEMIGVDIKATSKSHPATGVQIAGYELLAEQHGIKLAKRLGVRLKKDRTYEVTEYPDERAMFRSLVNVYNWNKRHA